MFSMHSLSKIGLMSSMWVVFGHSTIAEKWPAPGGTRTRDPELTTPRRQPLDAGDGEDSSSNIKVKHRRERRSKKMLETFLAMCQKATREDELANILGKL